MLVHEIVLDLGKGPVVGIHDLPERFHAVMEREARVPDPAVGNRRVQEIRDAQVCEVIPELPAEPVHQVIVDVVGLQLCELLIEEFVHVRPGRDHPGGQLGCDVHLLPVPARKRPAHEGLALAGMVGVCRVHVVHAVVDGVPEHLGCEGFVDLAVLPYRQAHAAEAEDGEVFGF